MKENLSRLIRIFTTTILIWTKCENSSFLLKRFEWLYDMVYIQHVTSNRKNMICTQILTYMFVKICLKSFMKLPPLELKW